ncbi:hypothetical protein D3Y57_12725 [Sphingomonas paeninsulae]|jgi:uncharacterized protein (DUF4415 family)|uniref:BrnA antitoxin of type II toxin-antitoxin system n=1 Tax=Sphingomonas paeninsulae TaxID=2319844 RepID=A0A494TBZ4_SPHPE|nr:BrnA antitoxin family protein [Sphingomonas paeninsulae]AYJ86670.1 hypothetical protein D3Y57_12725 [Sphingomonas paeninsulae]
MPSGGQAITKGRGVTEVGWTDPDDAPELTDAWSTAPRSVSGARSSGPRRVFWQRTASALAARPPELSWRGVAKEQVTLRLDPDVIERFRADGPGWQGRINGVLRKAMGL